MKISNEQFAAFNADFVKIFASALSIGVIIFGYSYSHAFFRSFGISLFQLDMATIDIVFRGLALLQDLKVAAVAVVLIVLGSILFSVRNFVSPNWQLVIVAFSILSLTMGSIWGGEALGRSHARSIWADGAGKLAFCKLDLTEDSSLAPLAESLNKQALEQRLRLILRTKSHVYLAPVVENLKPNQNSGEAYEIPVDAISFCRIVGS